MILTADRRGEVDEAAVRRPPGRARLEIPVGGQVDRLPPGSGADEEIAWAAMIQLLLDDHVGTRIAHVGDVLAVRRESRIAVDVSVVGQPCDLAVGRHYPQVRTLVLQLVSP